jgi:membrane-associated phospholipid phosphatase
MIAATLAGLSADVIRGLTGRTRPAAKVEQGWFGPRSNGRWHLVNWKYNAFPSAHTSTAVGLAVAVLLASRGAGIALLPAALLIALSRVWLGAHRLSDICAGAALGAFVAIAVSRRMKSPSSADAAASENAVRR